MLRPPHRFALAGLFAGAVLAAPLASAQIGPPPTPTPAAGAGFLQPAQPVQPGQGALPAQGRQPAAPAAPGAGVTQGVQPSPGTGSAQAQTGAAAQPGVLQPGLPAAPTQGQATAQVTQPPSAEAPAQPAVVQPPQPTPPAAAAAQAQPVQPVSPTPTVMPPAVTPTREGTIQVVGEGEVRAQPDEARVTLGVEVFDPSLAAAQQQAAQRMTAVIQQLRQAGVPEENIRTVQFDIQPQFNFPQQPPRPAAQPAEPQQPVLTGFRVVNLVEVRTPDISRLGQVIDQVVQAGATRVENIRLEIANPDQLKDRARRQAVQDARSTAELLAQEAGVTLGRPIEIQEVDLAGGPPVFQEARALAAAQDVTTPIQPGQIQVRAAVRVRYAIE